MSVDFGVVKILSGPHEGKIGYYDDDEGPSRCYVYFGVPGLSEDYITINRRSLKPVPQEEAEEFERRLFDPQQKLDGQGRYRLSGYDGRVRIHEQKSSLTF